MHSSQLLRNPSQMPIFKSHLLALYWRATQSLNNKHAVASGNWQWEYPTQKWGANNHEVQETQPPLFHECFSKQLAAHVRAGASIPKTRAVSDYKSCK